MKCSSGREKGAGEGHGTEQTKRRGEEKEGQEMQQWKGEGPGMEEKEGHQMGEGGGTGAGQKEGEREGHGSQLLVADIHHHISPTIFQTYHQQIPQFKYLFQSTLLRYIGINQPFPHNFTLSQETNWEEINLHLNPHLRLIKLVLHADCRCTGRPQRLIDDKKGVYDEKWTLKKNLIYANPYWQYPQGLVMNSVGGHFE